MGRLGSRVAVLAQEVILADHPCVLPHHDPFPCPRAPHLDPALHPPCRAGDMRPCTYLRAANVLEYSMEPPSMALETGASRLIWAGDAKDPGPKGDRATI